MLKFSGSSEPTSGLEWDVNEPINAKTPRTPTARWGRGVEASEQMLEMTEAKHHALLKRIVIRCSEYKAPAHAHNLWKSLKKGADTDLPPEVRRRRMRSKIQWFTEVCKSHCIAHFAASFIVVRTNAFVAGSHQVESIQVENSLLGRVPCRPKATVTSQWSEFGYRVNDPSAGSPTETLLRLLLPLNDKVHETFHARLRRPRPSAV